jgi:hypothetical protein
MSFLCNNFFENLSSFFAIAAASLEEHGKYVTYGWLARIFTYNFHVLTNTWKVNYDQSVHAVVADRRQRDRTNNVLAYRPFIVLMELGGTESVMRQ